MSKTRPTRCPTCGSQELRQDEDVLDTWFSSWLWPFSTLGWPKKTKELAYFYPTATLVTAQEIIFFWVARMIMAGYFCMKQPPFTTVYIHGTVRDITGKKMSKSLGNIIDPLDIIKEYGTDALRYTLVTATAIGQDVFLSEERFVAGRNFANKLWNATRFVLTNAEGSRLKAQGGGTPSAFSLQPSALSISDRWILSRLQQTVKRVTVAFDKFLFNEAATVLYDFLWHDFCDWYVEIAKVQLQDPALNDQTSDILRQVLETGLRLLHPIMPFVTEELWQHVTSGQRSIMIADWPKAQAKWLDEEAEKLFERFKAVTVAIRTRLAQLNMTKTPVVLLISKNAATHHFFNDYKTLLQILAQVSTVEVLKDFHKQKDAIIEIVDDVEVVIPLGGLIDVQKETTRLQQQVDELKKHLNNTTARLSNPQFAQKAPADVIEQAKAQEQQLRDTLKKFSDLLALVQSL